MVVGGIILAYASRGARRRTPSAPRQDFVADQTSLDPIRNGDGERPRLIILKLKNKVKTQLNNFVIKLTNLFNSTFLSVIKN